MSRKQLDVAALYAALDLIRAHDDRRAVHPRRLATAAAGPLHHRRTAGGRVSDESYDLEMPFVVCASNGGPYDDHAFVAGYQAGRIDHALAVIAAVGRDGLKTTVDTNLVAQLDLVAMRHGFRMESEPADDVEGWTFVTFRPVGGE